MSEIPTNHGQVLAQEPIEITFEVAPRTRFQKLLSRYLPKHFKKTRTYTIPSTTLGNLVRISEILLSIKKKEDSGEPLEITHQVVQEHAFDFCRIVAIAITNTKAGPKRSLAETIHWSLDTNELLAVVMMVMKQMNVQAFLHTIVLMRGANVLDSGTQKSESPAPAMTSPQVPGNSAEV
ncbi:hypothetical protein SAMN05444008_102371 [Cnuella takakiae]|uniref:Uncharacterized protein n=1 Tax=Cnuella takakiae TaxID=1302690 RepID=A0A1M4VTE2_9BACT|nr:hypothetical protein [Cnuella takakiae]OLY92509.1 hypothetical protein BUE76_11875 [Cnuella takakiae]SHE72073.1 hypothetical protein SAMN05444008_102371 [Cnuella takakiae]